MKALRTLKRTLGVPDFVVGQDGERIRAGNDVIVSKGDTAYGIGVVLHIEPAQQIAIVRLYPWLSPDWDGEVHTFPASWVSLDHEYMERKALR